MRQPRLSLGSRHMPWCLCDAEGSTFFLPLLTVMQMFLHVSCLAQSLSLPRHAILSLACFLIIASASRQTPLQGFSAPPALPALLDSTLRGQGCAEKACQQLAQLWGGRQSCLLLQASFFFVQKEVPFLWHSILLSRKTLLRPPVGVQALSISGFSGGIRARRAPQWQHLQESNHECGPLLPFGNCCVPLEGRRGTALLEELWGWSFIRLPLGELGISCFWSAATSVLPHSGQSLN